MVVKPAAEVNALTKGPDLAARPLLTRATSGAVYLLDDPAILPPGAVVNPDGTVTAPGADGTAGDPAEAADGSTPGDDAGGCAVSRGDRRWEAGGMLVAIFTGAVASVIAGLRRRRRRR